MAVPVRLIGEPALALAQAHLAGPAGATVICAASCAQLNGTLWSRQHLTVGNRFETRWGSQIKWYLCGEKWDGQMVEEPHIKGQRSGFYKESSQPSLCGLSHMVWIQGQKPCTLGPSGVHVGIAAELRCVATQGSRGAVWATSSLSPVEPTAWCWLLTSTLAWETETVGARACQWCHRTSHCLA